MTNRIVTALLFTCIALIILACNQGRPAPEEATNAQNITPPSEPIFQLSTTPPPALNDRTSNWCYAGFGESLVVNAEEINTNRRYFFLPQGVTKLAVGPPGLSATLLFRPLSNGNVEIFTGANFPECLSNPQYLEPAGGASQMRYYNQKNIDFRMELLPENGHFKIILEFKPGASYAMSVNPCPDCH